MFNANRNAALIIPGTPAILPSISTSFVQDQKHMVKSDRFKHVTPADLAETLSGFGYILKTLHTGRARNADRADHQTTIARYRHVDALNITRGGKPVFADIVLKVPHLYGAIKGYIGLFCEVCKNGMVREIGQFSSISVNHLGDPASTLNTLLPQLVGQVETMVDEVRAMQARDLTPSEIATLARALAGARLDGIENVQNIQFSDLLTQRRVEDRQRDLFTVTNVMQENLMRFGVRYQKTVTNLQTGETSLKNQLARAVAYQRSSGDHETVRSVDLNATIWNEALKILSNAA